MTPRLFRPVDGPDAPTPPVGATGRRRQAVAVPWLLDRVRDVWHRPQLRRILHGVVIVLGLVCQIALLLTVAYLCDLALSLMELWAELARKHLEITL